MVSGHNMLIICHEAITKFGGIAAAKFEFGNRENDYYQIFHPIISESHFSLHNIPYGVFNPNQAEEVRTRVAIGDYVLYLNILLRVGLFKGSLLSESDCFMFLHSLSWVAFLYG